MSPRTIDLNCDLGEDRSAEGASRDLELLSVVSSINVACGGHAGDAPSMRRTALAALAAGVAVGAHPAYPDRANFGRVRLSLPPAAIRAAVQSQVEAMALATAGAGLAHVKPHGALYHAAEEAAVADAIAEGVALVDPGLPLVAALGSAAERLWIARGARVRPELFADRRYTSNGGLVDRSTNGAVLSDPAEAAAQAVRLAAAGPVGRRLTLCVHSDTPNAVAVAQAVRRALESAGWRVAAHGAD